ncbi:MAG: alkaline phosphatase family protein [Deltaproteobacteria bacterium]|nr:alkaline phosphatase family protein [Deltaproteobacteria bacterium]
MITADHGMANISLDRVVFVDDYLNAQQLQTVTWTPVLSFYPTEGLSAEEAVTALNQSPHLRCAKKEDRPPDQHLSNHPRLPPVICDADEGWSISGREWFGDYQDLYQGGAHGYDPVVESMHGVILGRGPRLSGGRAVGPTRAVDVYNLLAALLQITPATNSGDPAVAEEWLGGATGGVTAKTGRARASAAPASVAHGAAGEAPRGRRRRVVAPRAPGPLMLR